MTDLKPLADAWQATDATAAAAGHSDDSELTEDEYPLLEDEIARPNVVSGRDAETETSTHHEAILMMQVVLETKPFTHKKGILKRWDAAAKLYHERLPVGAAYASANALKWRVGRLHRIYCGADSVKPETLPAELLALLARYDEVNPEKRPLEPATRERSPTAKRRRHSPNASPPAMLFKLDMGNDIRMLRAYLDAACFIDKVDGWAFELLDTAAAARGAEWSRDHAREHLDRLVKLLRRGEPALHGESPAHQRLRDLLDDYTDYVIKLSRFLKTMRRGLSGARHTLDDMLLEDVLALKPFVKPTDHEEHAVWNEIAVHFNQTLGTKVMFTGRLCFERCRFLRETRLAGGTNDSIRITPSQAQLLSQIEDLCLSAPVRASTAPPAADEDISVDCERPVVELPEPSVNPQVGKFETKFLKELLREAAALRPFEFGEREMLVWDKIRANVNFEMRHEIIASKEECRALVVGLCLAHSVPNHAEIVRLKPLHLELLRSILTQEGVPQLNADDLEDEVETSRFLANRLHSVRAPPGRGESSSRGRGRSHGRGRERGDGPQRTPETLLVTPRRGPGRPPGRGRGNGGGRGRGSSSVRPSENSLTRDRRLEDRINALTRELATIKRVLKPQPANSL